MRCISICDSEFNTHIHHVTTCWNHLTHVFTCVCNKICYTYCRTYFICVNSHAAHASEPQRRVRDFCLSISDLSELRRDFICLSQAGRLYLWKGSGFWNFENSLHVAGMLILFGPFLGPPFSRPFRFLNTAIRWSSCSTCLSMHLILWKDCFRIFAAPVIWPILEIALLCPPRPISTTQSFDEAPSSSSCSPQLGKWWFLPTAGTQV